VSATSRICFVSYSYADLPLPKEFDTLFRFNRDETIVRREEEIDIIFQPYHLSTATFARIRIVAVTQQFAEVWQEVPDGWKTVCVIDFPDGAPALIDALPTVDAWGVSREVVALCSRETLEAIQQDLSIEQIYRSNPGPTSFLEPVRRQSP
jgi:hypothetical protein